MCLQATEDRIDLMKRTVAEIQNCKDGLCLPDEAENTLLVFKKAELLQQQLLELEQVCIYCMHTQACKHGSRNAHYICLLSAGTRILDRGTGDICHAPYFPTPQCPTYNH